MKKFSFLGGDLITLKVVKMLSEKGYSIMVLGFEDALELKDYENISIAKSVKEAVEFSDILIFGKPITDSLGNILTTFSLSKYNFEEVIDSLKNSDKKTLIISEDEPEELKGRIIDLGHEIIEMDKIAKFRKLRSIVTSEGVLKIVIEEHPKSVFGLNVLVLGYGSLGKTIAKNFSLLGAKVTVAARREKVLENIIENGYRAIDFSVLDEKLNNFDLIINAVPATVLDEKNLKFVNKKTLLIDLSINPQGIDKKECRKLGLRYNWLLSVGSRYAPESFADIIVKSLESIK